MKILEINFKLEALFRHDDRTGVYAAFCPALEIYSQGTTLIEAKLALESAITMFIRECYRQKSLDDFLVESGFETTKIRGTVPPDHDLDEDGEFIALREAPVEKWPMKDHVDVPIRLSRSERSLCLS